MATPVRAWRFPHRMLEARRRRWAGRPEGCLARALYRRADRAHPAGRLSGGSLRWVDRIPPGSPSIAATTGAADGRPLCSRAPSAGWPYSSTPAPARAAICPGSICKRAGCRRRDNPAPTWQAASPCASSCFLRLPRPLVTCRGLATATGRSAPPADGATPVRPGGGNARSRACPRSVLVSPARRTQETLEALEPWEETPLVESVDQLYLAGRAQLLVAFARCRRDRAKRIADRPQPWAARIGDAACGFRPPRGGAANGREFPDRGAGRIRGAGILARLADGKCQADPVSDRRRFANGWRLSLVTGFARRQTIG